MKTSVPDATLSAVAQSALRLAHYSRALFVAEVALARSSLRALLVGAFVLPVLALSAWLALVALFADAVHIFSGSWLFATLVVAVLQVLLVALLLRFLRRWSRDLTLPQSRAAILRVLERMP
ncbi:MAG: hypothetical protein P4L92_11065 [Rudaea sp.]|nr:hypothetical protein [Rudaea sp.]